MRTGELQCNSTAASTPQSKVPSCNGEVVRVRLEQPHPRAIEPMKIPEGIADLLDAPPEHLLASVEIRVDTGNQVPERVHGWFHSGHGCAFRLHVKGKKTAGRTDLEHGFPSEIDAAQISIDSIAQVPLPCGHRAVGQLDDMVELTRRPIGDRPPNLSHRAAVSEPHAVGHRRPAMSTGSNEIRACSTAWTNGRFRSKGRNPQAFWLPMVTRRPATWPRFVKTQPLQKFCLRVIVTRAALEPAQARTVHRRRIRQDRRGLPADAG